MSKKYIIELTNEAYESICRYEKDGGNVPPEFFDFILILEPGAAKYGTNTFLNPDASQCHMMHKKNHDHMFHHLAESFSNHREDPDTKLDPLLHLATRALMLYTRLSRGLAVHENNTTEIIK